MLPAAALLELIRAAGEHNLGMPVDVVGLTLQSPAVVPESGSLLLQVRIDNQGQIEVHGQMENR